MESNTVNFINLDRLLSIFGRSINSLQLAQVIREQHAYPSPEYDMMERVVMRTMCERVSDELNASYAGGVPINDLYDAMAAKSAPYCLAHDEEECKLCGESDHYPAEEDEDRSGRDYDQEAKDASMEAAGVL